MEALDERPFQPKDTFMADTSSFHVIGGPNMAGKSTYLRQACLSACSHLVSAHARDGHVFALLARMQARAYGVL
jgi:DNA mismatch repair ATPase MutS